MNNKRGFFAYFEQVKSKGIYFSLGFRVLNLGFNTLVLGHRNWAVLSFESKRRTERIYALTVLVRKWKLRNNNEKVKHR